LFLVRCQANCRTHDINTSCSHLAEAADEYIRQSLSPEAARRAARRSFGGVTQSNSASPLRGEIVSEK
jgi:hypothetical protein